MVSEGHHRRGIAPERIAAVLARNAAESTGWRTRARLAVGYDADITIVDPEGARTVDPATLGLVCRLLALRGHDAHGLAGVAT
jgi:dihydroorotase-like cyclic amidohydrolase